MQPRNSSGIVTAEHSVIAPKASKKAGAKAGVKETTLVFER